jgi:hypothetical protein
MFSIAKAVDPKLADLPPPGLMGSGGDTERASAKFLNERIALSGGNMTIDAALDQFVARLDGFGWWVAEQCPVQGTCSCQLGLLTADNVLVSSYDISPPAGRRRP